MNSNFSDLANIQKTLHQDILQNTKNLMPTFNSLIESVSITKIPSLECITPKNLLKTNPLYRTTELLEKINLKLEHLKVNASELGKLLAQDQVFFIPFIDSASNVAQLLKESQKSKKSILEIYDDLFSTKESLSKILDTWCKNPFLKERRKILKSCLDAHFCKDYPLSIPVFYIQIESLCKYLLGVSDQNIKYTELKSSLKTAYASDRNENDILDQYYSEEYAIDFLVNQIFQHESTYKQESVYPNRHFILHGKDTNYYRKPFASLRCILILDVLADLEPV